MGPAATSSHHSALHFPALLAASPNSVSLTPYPSHALSLHLVSSISLSAPSPCALAAAPSCCAGWELPSCSPWGGSRGLLCTPGGHQHHPGDGSHLPHPSDPNSTCQGGGELPCSGQKEGVGCGCHLLGGAGTTSPCPGQGRHLTLIPLSIQPENPLTFDFMSYQHRNEPRSAPSFPSPGSWAPLAPGKTHPELSCWAVSQVSRGATARGLLQKSTPKR